MFPKILDSTFPIASEEPGPGAFRCPGSPPPTTPPPPRNRNGASQSRGRPRGLRGSRLLWAEARARRSLGHHPPHNLIPPGAAAAGALSLRRESRRPAEARPGPELPFPPQAPRERRRGSRSSAFSWLRRGRLRPFGPVPGPRAPRSPPTQATREAARLRRPVRSWILAGTRCAASSRRPARGLPPASTASSQFCRCRRRKRRRGNRLTSPPDYANYVIFYVEA